MSFCIGSGYLPAYSISNGKINDILTSSTPHEMSLWEKIKDFFCLTRQADALECIYKLCHPPVGTTSEDVKLTFEKLKELAHPGWGGNIQIERHVKDQFYIMDKDGKEILSVIIVADDYTITTGDSHGHGIARSYPYIPSGIYSDTEAS